MPTLRTLLAAFALPLADVAPAASTLEAVPSRPPDVTQDSTAALTCEAGAVFINIHRTPGVRFERIDRWDGPLVRAREFSFSQGPIRQVQVFLSALQREGVGPSSETRLSVIVRSAPSNSAANTTAAWWRLVPAGPDAPDDAASTLLFDATTVRRCFDGDPCELAELAPAADSAVALLVLGYSRDLGGANADNWEHARLVLDFREQVPRVAVAVDCAYNEGGGVCTAIASGRMSRSDLRCGWDDAASDFACTETSDDSHRDFQLFSGRPGSPRAGEVATLADAARRLTGRAPGSVEIVTGVGPVRLVHDVAVGGARLTVLASGGRFRLVDHTTDSIGPIRAIRSRRFYPNPVGRRDVPEVATDGWTSERGPVFRADEIFRSAELVVLRVVEARPNGRTPQAYAMYWLAIAVRGDERTAEAIEVVAPSSEGWCGTEVWPMVVTSVGQIGSSFEVPVTIQPSTTTEGKGDLSWETNPGDEDVVRCRRPGWVRWRNGAFEVEVSDQPCAAAESPLFVILGFDGSIRLAAELPFP